MPSTEMTSRRDRSDEETDLSGIDTGPMCTCCLGGGGEDYSEDTDELHAECCPECCGCCTCCCGMLNCIGRCLAKIRFCLYGAKRRHPEKKTGAYEKPCMHRFWVLLTLGFAIADPVSDILVLAQWTVGKEEDRNLDEAILLGIFIGVGILLSVIMKIIKTRILKEDEEGCGCSWTLIPHFFGLGAATEILLIWGDYKHDNPWEEANHYRWIEMMCESAPAGFLQMYVLGRDVFIEGTDYRWLSLDTISVGISLLSIAYLFAMTFAREVPFEASAEFQAGLVETFMVFLLVLCDVMWRFTPIAAFLVFVDAFSFSMSILVLFCIVFGFEIIVACLFQRDQMPYICCFPIVGIISLYTGAGHYFFRKWKDPTHWKVIWVFIIRWFFNLAILLYVWLLDDNHPPRDNEVFLCALIFGGAEIPLFFLKPSLMPVWEAITHWISDMDLANIYG